jgi:DNA-binding CsgD family transcriptional regulator
MRRKWTCDDIEIIKAMVADGATNGQIAEKFGANPRMIKEAMRRFGVKRSEEERKALMSIGKNRFWTEARIILLRHMIESGMRYAEIAKQMGVSKGAVKRQACDHGFVSPGTKSEQIRDGLARKKERESHDCPDLLEVLI